MKKPKTNNAHVNTGKRSFIKKTAMGLGMLGTSSVLGLAPTASFAKSKTQSTLSSATHQNRVKSALNFRIEAAQTLAHYSLQLPPQLNNGDEPRYADDAYYASFTKTLPHNRFGEVETSAFEKLQKATQSGLPADFAQIPLAPNAGRQLTNPQGAYRYILAGLDGHATRIRPAPTFRSAETTAEMGEVYWLALTRDVPFSDYANNNLIHEAIADLNQLSATVGPKNNGRITTDTIFRGSTPGDLIGPYVSQFLWKDIPYGLSTIEQRYAKPVAKNFMTTEDEWLRIQNGANPNQNTEFEAEKYYLYNNRGMAEYVHRDVLFQAFFNAAMIMLQYGNDAVSPNPYTSGQTYNQGGFTSFGEPFVIDMLTQAGNLALQGAWYQKWVVHRRLRPETFGGRLHFTATGQRKHYELNQEFYNLNALQKTYSQHGSYLLPMAFPEGSPTHPSFPAGHAMISGACATILKAYFNEDFVIPDPQIPDASHQNLTDYAQAELKLGNEINKLANNIALSRDAAGVHYRSDGTDGIATGEQQAIGLLVDYTLALNEDFDGFTLTKFDGARILIKNGQLHYL